MEAKEQGCICRPKVTIVEEHEGGMMELEVAHEERCKAKRQVKDRG